MSQNYHSKNQNIRLHNDLLILHVKQKHNKSIVWMFNWWTCGVVSYLSPVYGGSDVTLTFQYFLKNRNRMSGKTVQRDRHCLLLFFLDLSRSMFYNLFAILVNYNS
jgi:hypothetical protein